LAIPPTIVYLNNETWRLKAQLVAMLKKVYESAALTAELRAPNCKWNNEAGRPVQNRTERLAMLLDGSCGKSHEKIVYNLCTRRAFRRA
jgi:hypothetical protein